MPNWSDDEFIVYSESQDHVVEFAKKISECYKHYYKSDFEDRWLGNLLIGFGICSYDDIINMKSNISCRGWFNGFTLNEENDLEFDPNCSILEEYIFPKDSNIINPIKIYCLLMQSSTAWDFNEQLWYKLIEKSGFSDLELLFCSEEYGNCSFRTNDKDGIFFPDRYSIAVEVDIEKIPYEYQEYFSDETIKFKSAYDRSKFIKINSYETFQYFSHIFKKTKVKNFKDILRLKKKINNPSAMNVYVDKYLLV